MAEADSLARFLDQRAALVAQKSVIGYCNVKTSLPLPELISEKQFAEAFEQARWAAYAAVLADLLVIAEGRLRAAAGPAAPRLADRLAALYGKIVRSHPALANRPEGSADAVARLRTRLAEAQEAPPHGIAEIARVSARAVFASLPIHERLRQPDRPAVEAGVRFLLVGLAREFDRDLDHAALAADLLAGAPEPEPSPAPQ